MRVPCCQPKPGALHFSPDLGMCTLCVMCMSTLGASWTWNLPSKGGLASPDSKHTPPCPMFLLLLLTCLLGIQLRFSCLGSGHFTHFTTTLNLFFTTILASRMDSHIVGLCQACGWPCCHLSPLLRASLHWLKSHMAPCVCKSFPVLCPFVSECLCRVPLPTLPLYTCA